MPGQSTTTRHSTQWPTPSHTLPPIVHGVEVSAGSLNGMPSLQTSLVHGLPSSMGTQAAPPGAPVPPVPPVELDEVVVAEEPPWPPVPVPSIVALPPHPSQVASMPRNKRATIGARF